MRSITSQKPIKHFLRCIEDQYIENALLTVLRIIWCIKIVIRFEILTNIIRSMQIVHFPIQSPESKC